MTQYDVTNHLIYELLGCSLLELEKSFWAVRLDRTVNGKKETEWVCERRTVHSWQKGEERNLDWGLDLVSSGDYRHITELWLFCPPSSTSPLGNTAYFPIKTACTGFQFKIASADFGPYQTRYVEAHVIGRVMNSLGNCEFFAFDYREGGLLTPQWRAPFPNPVDGTPFYPCINYTVRNFGRVYDQSREKWHDAMWRPNLVPPGVLELSQLGVEL